MIAAALLLAATTGDPISGTWEGTSLCQVKPSPCHDERVIYRFKRTAPKRYRIDAYRLVERQEQFMGPVDVTFDPVGAVLDGITGGSGKAAGRFRLVLHGSRLIGRITLTDGSVYRLIDVGKR
jgi:hypothetical protein